jgi:thioredoxin 1
MRGYLTSPADLTEPPANLDSGLVTNAVATAEDAAAIESVSFEATPSYQRTARPIDVTARQFDRLLWNNGLVLVKFGADWCGPCRKVVPQLEQLAADNTGKLTVLTVDVDKERRLADKHNVGPIPRLLLFRNGVQIDHWTGYQSARQMQKGIDRAIASEPKGKVQGNPFSI